jgi:Ni/Fe-hydrogenase subunit HybB-like protein
MTIIESNLSARLRAALEAEVLQSVASGRDRAEHLSGGARRDFLRAVLHDPVADLPGRVFFLLEITIGFIIPIMLFSTVRVRKNSRWLYHAAQMTLLGFIINRLNVAITGFELVSGKTYVPAWTEIAVTLMLVTLGVTAFYLAARMFPVFERDVLAEERAHTWRLEVDRQASLRAAPVVCLGGSKGREG